MSAPDPVAIRRAIAYQLQQVSGIARVNMYDQREIGVSEMPLATIFFDSVMRPKNEEAERFLGHDDFEMPWTVQVYISLDDYQKWQEQYETIAMGIRTQFDANPQFSDPETGLTMDSATIEKIEPHIVRDTQPMVVVLVADLNILISQ